MKAYAPIFRIRWPLVLLATIFGLVATALRAARYVFFAVLLLVLAPLCVLAFVLAYAAGTIRHACCREEQP